MSSGESGKVKRVVLLALVCAGCAAAPVIVLREGPAVDIAEEARATVESVQVASPAVVSVEPPAREVPVEPVVKIIAAPAAEPNQNDLLRSLSFG
jgi:hypothetical protein